MPIKSSKIIQDHLQTYGMRQIREEHTDHLGRKYYYQCEVGKDVDAEKNMLNRVTHVEKTLIDQETEEVIKIIEHGGQMPKLEFTNATDVKLAFTARQTEHEVEITDLTTRKTNLESEVK